MKQHFLLSAPVLQCETICTNRQIPRANSDKSEKRFFQKKNSYEDFVSSSVPSLGNEKLREFFI